MDYKGRWILVTGFLLESARRLQSIVNEQTRNPKLAQKFLGHSTIEMTALHKEQVRIIKGRPLR